MRKRGLEIRAEGAAKTVAAFKDFEPRDQVHARLQLSGGRWPRRRVAGVDLRGDGTFVPYRGGVRREELDPSRDETPFETVRAALAGSEGTPSGSA
jgi:hypothetical protein